MTAFVLHLPLTSTRHSTSVRQQALNNRRAVWRTSKRCIVRMNVPQDESEEEGPVQGPSQAPTKAGISTAGLSEIEAKFIQACYTPDVERIEQMLDDGIDHAIADINGRTALHFCAGNGLPTLCRRLLELGADVNKQDITGLTPLHMATGYKKVDTVRYLIEAGADANITCFQGQLSVELAESMLEKTPKKRFFVPNGDYTKLKELVELLDEVTEEEDEGDIEQEGEESEFTEETESAKFVVRVKPKGTTTHATPPSAIDADDVKVTIRVKEPETKVD